MEINKVKLQDLLEKQAIKRNRGMCESYNYCQFCKEPKEINRISDTPCADAYIDMKKITNLLKKRKEHKEYIEITSEKIDLWEKELEKYWDDEVFLNSWYGELRQVDTFGMPKSTGNYTFEMEIIEKEKIRKKIKDFINLERDRLKSVKIEYFELEEAINSLDEKDRFIIECRYGDMKLNIDDTIVSYYKKYENILSIDQIKKKIACIKRKIYKKMYKK